MTTTTISGLGARSRRRRRGLSGGKGSGPRGMTCLRFKSGKGGRKVCAKFSKGAKKSKKR